MKTYRISVTHLSIIRPLLKEYQTRKLNEAQKAGSAGKIVKCRKANDEALGAEMLLEMFADSDEFILVKGDRK